jgi:hypothetical protein
LVVTLATAVDSVFSSSSPGVLMLTFAAPAAVAVTVKLAGTRVVPVSERLRMTPPAPPSC